jgi:hypothetical protein
MSCHDNDFKVTSSADIRNFNKNNEKHSSVCYDKDKIKTEAGK